MEAIGNYYKLLTKREHEVLGMIAEGLNYKEAGQRLYVSTETIKKHLRNVYVKLEVNNKIAAINKIRG